MKPQKSREFMEFKEPPAVVSWRKYAEPINQKIARKWAKRKPYRLKGAGA